MTIEEIERLVRQAEKSQIAVFEYQADGATLTLRIGGSAAKLPTPAKTPPADPKIIPAPFAGVFLAGHPLETSRPGKDRTRFAKDDIIGYLKVGWCLRPLRAPADCVIGGQLVEDGTLVGYGTPLYAS